MHWFKKNPIKLISITFICKLNFNSQCFRRHPIIWHANGFVVLIWDNKVTGTYHFSQSWLKAPHCSECRTQTLTLFSFFMVCLCSDLINSVFPALSCCLLHLWSHPEGRCRTESVPLHVGDTRYVHLVNASILWSLYYNRLNSCGALCVCLQTTVHGLKLQRGRTWTLWRTCSNQKANSNSLWCHSLSLMHNHRYT